MNAVCEQMQPKKSGQVAPSLCVECKKIIGKIQVSLPISFILGVRITTVVKHLVFDVVLSEGGWGLGFGGGGPGGLGGGVEVWGLARVCVRFFLLEDILRVPVRIHTHRYTSTRSFLLSRHLTQRTRWRTHKHEHTHTHELTHTHKPSRTHPRTHTDTYTHTHALKHKHTHSNTHSLSHARTHIHTLSLSHTHTHAHRMQWQRQIRRTVKSSRISLIPKSALKCPLVCFFVCFSYFFSH